MFTFTHTLGQEDVLVSLAHLDKFARSAGQIDVVERFRFSFSVPNFGSKLPHLIVLCDAHGVLYAVAVVLEYRVSLCRTGIYVPVDAEGDLTIIAPREHRAHAAEMIAHFLLAGRARLVFVSLNSAAPGASRFLQCPLPVAAQSRNIRRTLPLLSTLDETLAQLGARSRRNLRHGARRARREHGAQFVSNAELTETMFLTLNRGCAYPVVDQVARWRYQTVRSTPGAFLSGLRSADGTWLSLLGGRRQGSVSIVDWQMNRADLGTLSIGTAMRFVQMECEIQYGATSLQFNGGTQHSMQHAFLQETVTDVLWMRASYAGRTVRALVSTCLPRNNLLKTVLNA